MFSKRAWNPIMTIGLINLHGLAAAAVLFYRPRPIDLALAFAGYVWFGLASSFYYHRYLTHKGFGLALPLQWFFLAGGLIGLSGDPVRWVATHRYHHQRPDREDDIHSPLDGWWYAHFGWIAKLDLAEVERLRPLAADARRIPWLRAWENPVLAMLPHMAYAGLLLATVGVSGTLWGLYVPLVASFHFCWMMVASFCHMPSFGTRGSETADRSRNIAWLGPISFGEAFHNHHHAYPRRAKHGLAWHEIDPSKYFIWTLEKLGLAWDVIWEDPRGRVQVPEDVQDYLIPTVAEMPEPVRH
jgi:fatty-acid desaturase